MHSFQHSLSPGDGWVSSQSRSQSGGRTRSGATSGGVDPVDGGWRMESWHLFLGEEVVESYQSRLGGNSNISGMFTYLTSLGEWLKNGWIFHQRKKNITLLGSWWWWWIFTWNPMGAWNLGTSTRIPWKVFGASLFEVHTHISERWILSPHRIHGTGMVYGLPTFYHKFDSNAGNDRYHT